MQLTLWTRLAAAFALALCFATFAPGCESDGGQPTDNDQRDPGGRVTDL